MNKLEELELNVKREDDKLKATYPLLNELELAVKEAKENVREIDDRLHKAHGISRQAYGIWREEMDKLEQYKENNDE